MRKLLHQFLKWLPAALVGGAVAIAGVWEASRNWIGTQVLAAYAAMNAAPVLWLLFAVLLGIYVWALIYTGREPVQAPVEVPPPLPAPALFEAQLAELREVEDFVARKDENELRETFDFPALLEFNVREIRRSMTREPEEGVDAFFEGGAARIDVRRAKITPAQDGGAHNIEFIPGRVGFINISKKYIENRRNLARMIDSPRLPTDVIATLRRLDEAVEENSESLLILLDEAMLTDRNIVLNYARFDRPLSGWINHTYWRRFKSLKPIAADLSAEIRRYLNVG